MILRLAVALAFLLTFMMPLERAYGDSLSISAWSTGDSLSATQLNSRNNSISTWANGLIANDNIKSDAAIVGSKLNLTSGTGRFSNTTSVTSDAPIITSAQTWNNAATAFSGWRLNIVNTNSASISRLLDLQVDSTVIASISRTGQLVLNSQAYASGPRTLMDGAWFNIASATYTDNITAASGTAPRFIAYSFQRPAVAAGNSSVTTTHAATVFIASAPVTSTNMTLTNRYALWVDQGDVRIGGNMTASGTAMVSGAFQTGTGGSPAGQAYIKSAAANAITLVVDTAASPSANAQEWRLNGSLTSSVRAFSGAIYFAHEDTNLGNDVAGPQIITGINSSAGAVGQSAGTVVFRDYGTNNHYVWSDGAAKMRTHTSAPTGSAGAPTVGDTAGTVIGDQTSWHETKNILRQWNDPKMALETVLATKVYDFRYKEASYLDADNQPAVFTGIVGFDRHDWFLKNVGRQQVPSLNEINLHGYTILAIQALEARLRALEIRK